jgi:hypothetical protein
VFVYPQNEYPDFQLRVNSGRLVLVEAQQIAARLNRNIELPKDLVRHRKFYRGTRHSTEGFISPSGRAPSPVLTS